MKIGRIIECNDLEYLGYVDNLLPALWEMMEDTRKGERDDFHIPLKSGEIKVYNSDKKESTADFSFYIIDDEAKQKLLKKFPDYLMSPELSKDSKIQLSLDRDYKSTVLREIVEYRIEGRKRFFVRPVIPEKVIDKKHYKNGVVEGYMVDEETREIVRGFENISKKDLIKKIEEHPGKINLDVKSFVRFGDKKQELNFSVNNITNRASGKIIYRGTALGNIEILLSDIFKTLEVGIDESKPISCIEYKADFLSVLKTLVKKRK